MEKTIAAKKKKKRRKKGLKRPIRVVSIFIVISAFDDGIVELDGVEEFGERRFDEKEAKEEISDEIDGQTDSKNGLPSVKEGGAGHETDGEGEGEKVKEDGEEEDKDDDSTIAVAFVLCLDRENGREEAKEETAEAKHDDAGGNLPLVLFVDGFEDCLWHLPPEERKVKEEEQSNDSNVNDRPLVPSLEEQEDDRHQHQRLDHIEGCFFVLID